MIVSASRRTDIPAFYGKWLINRLKAGYFLSVNPFNPGQTKTVSLKAEDVDANKYQDTDYFEAGIKFRDYILKRGRNGLPVESVSKIVLKALTSAKPRVRYSITPNPLGAWLMSILPKRFIDNLIAKNLGLLN